jgi:hypothetical protein
MGKRVEAIAGPFLVLHFVLIDLAFLKLLSAAVWNYLMGLWCIEVSKAIP